MPDYDLSESRGKYRIRLSDMIVVCFVLWPFFWSIWKYLKLPVALFGSHFIVFFYFFLAAVSVFITPIKIKKPIVAWIVFYLVLLLELKKAVLNVFLSDFAISFCAWLICASVGQRKTDGKRIIDDLETVGLIVAVSVILERSLYLFSGPLSFLYTSNALSMAYSSGFNGGMIPYSSYSGCIVYPGFAAFGIKQIKQTRRGFGGWLKLMCFLMCIVMLRKRGFILDTVVAVLFILLLNQLYKKRGRINLKQVMRRLSVAFALLIVLIISYYTVPVFQEAVDSLLMKINEENGNYSGRVQLYNRAMNLFKSHWITGIGWGQYRNMSLGVFVRGSTKTYEAHNVYLQLLCENGIIGFAAFLAATVSMLVYSSKQYIALLQNQNANRVKEMCISLSLFLQVFFLAYCMSGNPLYDYNFAVTYFIGVLLSFI